MLRLKFMAIRWSSCRFKPGYQQGLIMEFGEYTTRGPPNNDPQKSVRNLWKHPQDYDGLRPGGDLLAEALRCPGPGFFGVLI